MPLRVCIYNTTINFFTAVFLLFFPSLKQLLSGRIISGPWQNISEICSILTLPILITSEPVSESFMFVIVITN